ncbi:hypothetical protein [Desulfovibrio sp.]|uniref:hypothetical protein n=1 Tax=Desulfovibrio sp. TaxID=885 RepID=UPI0025C0BCAF|nr:hypothetical protein [Desulfovibrio sp.]
MGFSPWLMVRPSVRPEKEKGAFSTRMHCGQPVCIFASKTSAGPLRPCRLSPLRSHAAKAENFFLMKRDCWEFKSNRHAKNTLLKTIVISTDKRKSSQAANQNFQKNLTIVIRS